MAGPGLSFFGEEEKKLLIEVIDSQQLWRYRFAQEGEEMPSKVYCFEHEFETYLGSKHCIGMNSCTSALFAALSALGIGPGDEVIVPGYTFIASISAIAYVRATPILCEIDSSFTLDPEDVQRRITSRTRAILAVHMLGAPCDMDSLTHIAKEYGIAIIEDVAQACGGEYKGQKLGSIGKIGAFSLNIFKTITAGDGGVLATSDSKLYERAFAIHDHGSKPFRLGVADDESLLGLNLRMHEFTGAIALAQARKLPLIMKQLRTQKARFIDALGPIPHAQRRFLNDPEGECGTVLVLIFDSSERAARIAKAQGSQRLIESKKHYYGSMKQLLNYSMPKRNGCPFECPSYSSNTVYHQGQLPHTDDLLSRSIALSVGVVDSYLGTSFGINVLSSPEQVEQIASEFHQRQKQSEQE